MIPDMPMFLRRPLSPSVWMLLLACLGLPVSVWADTPLDRIVAVVEDRVILESELAQRLETVKRNLRQNNTPLPPLEVIARQVLERMIVEKIQIQIAERNGIKVDDETLRQAVGQIAQRNNLSPEQFRASLREEGIDYGGFVEQIRDEITLSRLRSSQINSQIKVSDREIQAYLETQGKPAANRDGEFLLGHILIATPEAAAPAAVQKARDKADKLVEELKHGLDFRQASLTSSDAAQALSGGDLGWRKLSQIPSLFADLVPNMKEGDIEGPIHSSSGFHIIKLLGVKGGQVEQFTKTHVRHILIKPNEVLSDDDVRRKLEALRTRIENGEDFTALARGHSDDKGSAVKGGDLGWVQPGNLVAQFQEAMDRLDVNQLSEPVQTQFGWHLIQVLGREQSADSDEAVKNQAREAIFKRKVEEETELWLRRIRDEAYVEIRLSEPEPESFLPTKR